MNELALFAGAGGGILGGALLGWTTVGAVELEPYPRNILLQRQRDGLLPPFPIWDDVCTFNGTPWRGLVDVVSGGFPCQDISAAGKGVGITGTRSGLWKQMHRIICEVRPRYAFMENSPMLTSRGLGTVLGDLAEAGYDAAWLVLGASDVGAPHVRKRIWILATDSNLPRTGRRLSFQERPHTLCNTSSVRQQESLTNAGNLSSPTKTPQLTHSARTNQNPDARSQTNDWWASEPNVGRVAHGVASRVDRLKAIGNGQVPLVAATAFIKLADILNQTSNIQN